MIRNISVDLLMSQYYCEKASDYRNDNQLNKAITVLRKAQNSCNTSKRPYSMLFEINIESNPSIALDNLVNVLEIDAIFIIILSKYYN